MEELSTQKHSIFNEWKFPAAIILMLASLVFSKWLLSVSQMLLFILILTDKNGVKGLCKAIKNPIVLILISVYFLHILGLLWSEDLKFGLHDLKIKLPLLTFPILFAAIPEIEKSKTLVILKSFLIFMGIMSVINMIRHYVIPHTCDFQPALWHSHIRFSLMLCLSIFIIIWLFTQKALKGVEKVSAVVLLAVFFVTLLFLESFTGLVIFALLIPFSAVLFRNFVKSRLIKISVASLLLVSLFLTIYMVHSFHNSFFPKIEIPNLSDLEKYTESGHKYSHEINTSLCENGNLIYTYICYEELVPEWNKRSNKKISIDSLWDANIQIRYLSSKGLRKDSAGVWALSENDIKNIENKIPNYRLAGMDPIRTRLYQFFWELSVYKNNNDPSGHSLTQRMEYWKAASRIIQQNFWTGVGTGDLQIAFDNMYNEMNSLLDEPYRLRAHNQYLSIGVGFGIIGFLIFLFSLVFPFFKQHIRHNILYIGFIFIFLLSMLNEDTLETQVGVSFYAIFNSLFIFVMKSKDFISTKLNK